MFGNKKVLALVPLLALLLLGAAGFMAQDDATQVATLVDVASEAALIDAGDFVVHGICNPQICFGLRCDGRPSGFICNPAQHCRCNWCSGVFSCHSPFPRL